MLLLLAWRAAAPGNSGHCKMPGFAVQPGAQRRLARRPSLTPSGLDFQGPGLQFLPLGEAEPATVRHPPIRPLATNTLAFQQ